MAAYDYLDDEVLVTRFKKAMDALTKYSKEGISMKTYSYNDKKFEMAKKAVVNWYNSHNGPAGIAMDDVYIVWFCKVLQNWKSLCGTNHSDGMYYEVTFDGDKNCAYVDAYKKRDNQKINAEEKING